MLKFTSISPVYLNFVVMVINHIMSLAGVKVSILFQSLQNDRFIIVMDLDAPHSSLPCHRSCYVKLSEHTYVCALCVCEDFLIMKGLQTLRIKKKRPR